MKLKNAFILILFCQSVLFLSGEEKSYYFEQISPESGFAFDAIYSISEDCNGFVWFGGNNGLYFSNSNGIQKINLLPPKKNVSQSLRITNIYHDFNCDLWVCTEEGLFKRDMIYDSFHRINLFTADSMYNTQKYIDKILQFDDDFYLILINSKAFYFNGIENVLHEIKFDDKCNATEITYIGLDSKNNILLGSSTGQIFTGTHPKEKFELFYKSELNYIRTICHDNNKYYVGFNEQGIEVINTVGDKIYNFNEHLSGNRFLPDNRVREIIKTDDGDIWVGTYEGIVVLGSTKNTVITNKENNGLPRKSIYVLHKGKNGIWIGTWAGGVAYYNKNNYRFNHIEKLPSETELKSVISAFVEDNKGNIWVGSEQAGINIFNPEEGKFIKSSEKISPNILQRIKSLTKLGNDEIVIGTLYQGLWIYDQTTEYIERISEEYFPDDCIIISLASSENELWIATRGARHSLFKYDYVSKSLDFYDIESELDSSLNSLRVWKLLIDSSQKLWACTDEGLYYKEKNDTAFHKCFKNDTVYALDRTMIYTVFEDKNELLWVGTKGKGIFKYNPTLNLLHAINYNEVSNSDVLGIVEDEQNNIWFSTNNGLFRHNASENKTTKYTGIDGLPGEQFTPNSALATSHGEIYFGSPNGFCSINTNKIKTNSIKPDILLSGLLINNKSYKLTEGFKANSFIVEDIKSVILKHNQNSLTFYVAANNFIKPSKNRYKYRLVNYQETWVEASLNKDITFTKVPPGNYILEVLASNNDNLWNNVPLRIAIKIQFPFWQKWYAIVFYVLVLFTITYMVYKETKLRLALRKEILVERYKNEAQEQLYTEKMRFFTNVSHEIRTPLTLVLSPLNNLLKKFQYDENTSNQLLTIKRNSQRLLRLTNQILDFRLLEVNKLKANYQKSNIIDICHDVFNCFELVSKEKQINFIFSSNYKMLWIDIDPDMIEKIVYNLVSNALKFSEEKGQVFLSIENKTLTKESYNGFISAGDLFYGKCVEIKVRDFGKGINAKVLPNIFERFSIAQDEKETGTGIGLNLCQEYARLHKGNILATSKEGKGSTFILNIPFQENGEFEKKSIVKQLSFERDASFSAASAITSKTGSKEILLLAEDNDELRNYLKNYLSNYFKVLTAKNGKQALEIAKEVIPDIIVTDILMPLVDGIELTSNLKSSPATNQIPIVALTALSESKYQKESLLKGIDSYLTKPVDETILLAQIENILQKSEINKKRSIKNNGTEGQAKKRNLSFEELAEEIVIKNLRNSNFDMNSLIVELKISRSTFHRKIKASTNQSPSEFIREIRLKQAVKMMKTNTYNIDEIGTYVGFNSTSYFIRSFKKKYGKTPKEYYSNLKSS